jgi:4-hydroxy-3-methylbut-2-enyl diphosphate reductase
VCRAIESRTYHIESAAELEAGWLSGARRIGVTAGASTPDAEIDATVRALQELCDG